MIVWMEFVVVYIYITMKKSSSHSSPLHTVIKTNDVAKKASLGKKKYLKIVLFFSNAFILRPGEF